jgi:hypothetical protein
MNEYKIETPKLGAFDWNGVEARAKINASLKLIVKQLREQLSKDYVSYEIKFNDFTYCLDASSNPRRRDTLIGLLLQDALITLVNDTLDANEDSKAWDRVAAIKGMDVAKEQVQSPMMAKAYEEIRLKAEKAKPLDLESLYVNMERPDWTQEKQIEFVKKGEDAKLVEK